MIPAAVMGNFTFEHYREAMAASDAHRQPAGNRIILTNPEVQRLLDLLAGSNSPQDRLIVSKLLSSRAAAAYKPKDETEP